METYGADALRLYLINSGLVRGEEQRFTDAGVKDMTRRALLPWYNAFSFLRTYASVDDWSPDKGLHYGSNVLDRWILSKLQTLKSRIAQEMKVYHLYGVVPRLFEFIEDLTNWYIRLNRSRFWGEEINANKIAAYSALYTAVSEVSTAMAPFAPFLAEHIYQELARLSGQAPRPESVHLCAYPEAEEDLAQPRLEEAVSRMQQVILLGRKRREEVRINLRTPLRSLTIVHRDAALLKDIEDLESYVRQELNVKQVFYDQDEAAYTTLYAKPNFPVLGRRLGKRMKAFQSLIEGLGRDEIENLESAGTVTLDGEVFDTEEIQIFHEAREGTGTLSNRFISIDLDCNLDEALVSEGYAREAVNRIQRARKDMGLHVADRIELTYGGDAAVVAALATHEEYVAGEVLARLMKAGEPAGGATEANIDGHRFVFDVRRAN